VAEDGRLNMTAGKAVAVELMKSARVARRHQEN